MVRASGSIEECLVCPQGSFYCLVFEFLDFIFSEALIFTVTGPVAHLVLTYYKVSVIDVTLT